MPNEEDGLLSQEGENITNADGGKFQTRREEGS